MQIPKIERSKNDPLIPKDAQDPSSLGNIRGAAIRDINKRFNFITKQIKAYIRENVKPTGSRQVNSQLHRYQLNSVTDINNHDHLVANATIFDYLFGDEEYEDFTDFLNGLLYVTLLSNSAAWLSYSRSYRIYGAVKWPSNWLMNRYIERATETGLQEVITSVKYQTTSRTVDRELASTIQALDKDNFTNSLSWQSSLKTQQRAAWSEMKMLTDGLTGTLSEILRQGTREGASTKEIIRRVTKSLLDSDEKDEGKARRKARNLVRNRINNSKREASRDHIDQLNSDVYSETEYEMRQLWFSALMPRTREWHGERHGEIHTLKEDEEFYAQSGNKYNCYCHQSAILVYKATGLPVVKSKIFDEMEKQKKLFLSSR